MLQNKTKRSRKTNIKAFTLIELLIVVLVIGILVALAVPQYRIAVGKAQFSTLKIITRNVQEAAQRYYMTYGTFEEAIRNLDITIPSGVKCLIWHQDDDDQVRCGKQIAGIDIYYYVYRSTGKPRSCMALSTNKTDIANRICQKDTGKKPTQAGCNIGGTACSYRY